tara:strand:- start:76 stop:270 length:195 start_codon:yes stop_codon:yes gene_type:complete
MNSSTYYIYNKDIGKVFKIEGKDKFIEWLNTYSSKGNYTYSSRYIELKNKIPYKINWKEDSINV